MVLLPSLDCSLLLRDDYLLIIWVTLFGDNLSNDEFILFLSAYYWDLVKLLPYLSSYYPFEFLLSELFLTNDLFSYGDTLPFELIP